MAFRDVALPILMRGGNAASEPVTKLCRDRKTAPERPFVPYSKPVAGFAHKPERLVRR